MKTRITELLSVTHPIFQGGMAWIADGRLAAAVSEGGGLGIISAMNADGDYLMEQIAIARSLTQKPIGVNIMLMSPHADTVAQAVIDAGVPVVTTGAGSPVKYMAAWKAAGIRVIPVIASSAMAEKVARAGADAVIAEGQESGGHIGELTTMALVPQVVDAMRAYGIPVIAAGGIADGRGLAASLMLGAEGVQMGTRFLVAKECGVHPNYKKMVLEAADTATVATGRRFSGTACRQIKNQWSRNFVKYEFSPEATAEGVNALGVGALRRAALDGDTKEGCFLAGQISGLVTREQPAAEILAEVVSEAEEILRGVDRWRG